MADNTTRDDFEKSYTENFLSGSLKFSTDYVSKFDLFRATKELADVDPKLISAVIRGGGGQLAVDFLYDQSELPKNQQDGRALDGLFKKHYTKSLGEDYLTAWDYASGTHVVK